MLVSDFFEDTGKLKREIITSPDFLSECLSNPLFEDAIVGSGSIFCLRNRTIYLYPSHLIPGTLFTHQSIARKIMENALKMTGRKRFPTSRYFAEEGLLNPPIYAYPCSGNLIYLDLKSAYYQIYQTMPIYTMKVRGRWNYAPPFLRDYLPSDLENYKLVRNSIGGMWRANTCTRIKCGGLQRTKQNFPTTSFSNWTLLQEHLHALGHVAISFGAYYVNNDGWIFRERSPWEEFGEFLNEHGLEWEIKARGDGYIAGIGMYSIGGLQTLRMAKGSRIDAVDRNSLDVLRLRRTLIQETKEDAITRKERREKT